MYTFDSPLRYADVIPGACLVSLRVWLGAVVDAAVSAERDGGDERELTELLGMHVFLSLRAVCAGV